ncbi:hypothetical protein ACU686_39905 [Yinghuangia aomiensis]
MCVFAFGEEAFPGLAGARFHGFGVRLGTRAELDPATVRASAVARSASARALASTSSAAADAGSSRSPARASASATIRSARRPAAAVRPRARACCPGVSSSAAAVVRRQLLPGSFSELGLQPSALLPSACCCTTCSPRDASP